LTATSQFQPYDTKNSSQFQATFTDYTGPSDGKQAETMQKLSKNTQTTDGSHVAPPNPVMSVVDGTQYAVCSRGPLRGNTGEYRVSRVSSDWHLSMPESC